MCRFAITVVVNRDHLRTFSSGLLADFLSSHSMDHDGGIPVHPCMAQYTTPTTFYASRKRTPLLLISSTTWVK
jgi:hypothetical protein